MLSWLAIHLIASMGLVAFTVRQFELPAAVLGIHFTVLLSLLLPLTAFLAGCFQLVTIRGTRRGRFCVVAALALVSTGLALLHLSTLLSHAAWGRGITLHLVQNAPAHLGGLFAAQPTIAAALVGLYALVVAAVGVAHGLAAPRLLGGLAGLVPLVGGSGRLPSLARATVLVAASVFVTEKIDDARRDYVDPFFHGDWAFEPVLGLLTQHRFALDGRRLAEAQEDARVRASYQPPASGFDRRNVVVIMVDCARADHMGVYGYERATTPFLQELHRRGSLRRVDLALSTCSESNCGTLSTLASRDARSMNPRVFKLNDLLRDLGYRVHLILSGDHRWYGLRALYGASVDSLADGLDFQGYSVNDDRGVLEAARSLEHFDGTPLLLYAHLMSVHLLGANHPEYEVFLPTLTEVRWDVLWSGSHDPEVVTNRHDNGLLQADDTIRQLFEILDEKGYLERSIAVILGDHGEALGEHVPRVSHGETLYQEDIRIPILFYDTEPVPYPGLEFATQLDVAPTILDRLGLPIPSTWQGRSLLEEPPSEQISFHATHHAVAQHAVVHRHDERVYKYLYDSRDGGSEELYELRSDPSERRNLIDSADPDYVQELRVRLARHQGWPDPSRIAVSAFD